MNHLIDTNIISELRKGPRCNSNVSRWYQAITGSSLYLSVLVLGEVRKGIERTRSRDPAQARALERWLADVSEEFGTRILTIDGAVADEWGRMNATRPLPVVDGLLAATAKVHGLALVTRDVRDVADLGVHIINPFEHY